MGLFKGIKGRVAGKEFKYDTKHCLTLLLLSTVYADDWESRSELLVLRQIMSKSPLFSDSDDTYDKLILERCKQHLKSDADSVDAACEHLATHLRKTAFAMAVEIVFADGLVHQQEEAFIYNLKDKLSISDSFARGAIETFEALYSSGE